MAIKNFIVFSLVLLVGWAIAFGHFNKYFDGAEIEKKKVAALERRLHTENRKIVKLESKFYEFKEALVLSGIKIEKNTPWQDQKREIASVIALPQSGALDYFPRGHFALEQDIKVFKSGNYKKSAELFEDFLQKYPDHPSLAQATYFLGESYYLLGNMEGALRALNLLISHFPETEEACFGMVRLGKIFEKQERLEDANDIYKMVLPMFPKSKCADIAQNSMQGLNL